MEKIKYFCTATTKIETWRGTNSECRGLCGCKFLLKTTRLVFLGAPVNSKNDSSKSFIFREKVVWYMNILRKIPNINEVPARIVVLCVITFPVPIKVTLYVYFWKWGMCERFKFISFTCIEMLFRLIAVVSAQFKLVLRPHQLPELSKGMCKIAADNTLLLCDSEKRN